MIFRSRPPIAGYADASDRAGIDNSLNPRPQCRFQDVPSTLDVGAVELDRVASPQAVVRRHMIERRATLQSLRERCRIPQIADRFFDGEAGEPDDVARWPNERPHGLTLLDEQAGHVASDESRSACDENHVTCEPLAVNRYL